MAASPNLLAGTVYITVAGRQLMLAGQAMYRVSATEREPKMSMSGFEGYSEKLVPGKITFQVRDSAGLDVAALGNMANVTVVLELANGKRVLGTNMFVANTPEVNTVDGTLDIEFVGQAVEELAGG